VKGILIAFLLFIDNPNKINHELEIDFSAVPVRHSDGFPDDRPGPPDD
jgi:hypothetical protein